MAQDFSPDPIVEPGNGLSPDIAHRPLSPIWLSILIPVYNVEPYLRLCVDSILSQHPDSGVEIILLDDVSTDNSRMVSETLCKEYGANLRLMQHDKNSGLSAARNSMLDAAKGDYIWFIDSDDEMVPGALASLKAILQQVQPDIILCDHVKQGEHFNSFHGISGKLCTDREALVRGIFSSRRMHTWTKIARRDLWSDDLRFPVGRCFEDAATTPWLFLRACSFYYIPEPWIMYRVREGSITALVSRTRGCFDDRKNDDLACSLAGFSPAAQAALPDMAPETRYAIAQFCAKEFTKISWRLLSTRLFKDKWSAISVKLARYRGMMEDSSPLSFPTLNKEHRRQRRLGRWFVLGLFLLIVPRR